MNKKKKIWLVILIVLLVVLLTVSWFCKDLIKVVFTGITETPEQIEQKKEELDIKQKEALEKAGVGNIRPLDENEKEELNKGNITKEEAIEIITGKTTIDEIKKNKETGNSSDKPAKKPAETQKPQDNTVNDKVAKLVGEIYVLEANFTSELNALEAWALGQFVNLPMEQKAAKKKELAAIGFPKLAALESECDGKVNSVLKELEKVLKDAGQSTELVKQIREAYEEKKIVTKSHYISEYM